MAGLSLPEIEHLVSRLKPLFLEPTDNVDVSGVSQWADQSEGVEKLAVGAVLQAGRGGEEVIGRILVDNNKVEVLVQQIIVQEAWREEVLPRLLRLGQPASSFPCYSALFQEGSALALLETVIFHADVAENLGDAGTDLVDYCVR